jgi:conjugal transfer pilin signal peptidase TrbI
MTVKASWQNAAARGTLLAGLGAAALALTALGRFATSHAFMLNLSPSLPHWALWVELGQRPLRGQIVVFDPPHSALLEAHFGKRPRAFAKYALGLPGDSVTREGQQFFVNGNKVALAKLTTRRGEALTPGPTGLLPPGCYFVGTPHPRSFDSRYREIGWICGSRILGTARPIL